MADRDVSYRVTADTKQAEDSVSKLGKKAEDTDSSINLLKGTLGKASIAVAAVAATVGGLIASYKEQEQAEIKIAQTLKNTGFAAGLSAKELGAYASQLQNVTTFGDEAILAAQAVLLRFDSIGRDVFPRATEATLDLAQGMGIDLESAARLLGKALQEPTEGLTALRKAGVFFSGEQENIIQSAINAGDAIKAQTLVLDELNSKFGGLAAQAATGSGALTQTANILSDIAESGGKILLPFVLKLNEQLALTASFWRDVADSIANVSTDQLKADISATEAELAKLEGAYKAAKIEQDNLETNKGFLSTRDAIAKSEQDIIKYGVTSGNTANQILGQWTELTQKLNDLRKQLGEEEKKEYAGSVEARTVANQAKEAEERRFNEALIGLRSEYRTIEEDEFTTDLDRTNNQLLLLQQKQDEANFKKIKAEQGAAAAIEAVNKKTYEFKKKNSEENIKLQEAENQRLLKLREDFFSTAISLSNSENKALAAIGKAAALTDLAIKTPLAVANSFEFGTKTGGPILGAVLAGIAATAMAAQAAKIVGVKLAEGGLVEGPSSFGKVDNIPAALQAGELVAPRQNFDEVVEAVARSRGFTRDGESSQSQSVDVKIGFTENAFELIETKLLQRQALGV